MDTVFQARFIELWHQYFNSAPLPITFRYADGPGTARAVKAGEGARCIIAALGKVREGESLAYNAAAVGCPGGKRYLGFSETLMPDFEYFLSCGIPGKMEGERYKKTPEMVQAYMTRQASVMKAPGQYIVFKRWDKLEPADEPEVVVFYGVPDVISGLFTLANYDETEPNAVITPFGSGCAGIVQYPYMEVKAARPRAVIGMMDVSARPFVQPEVLTFAAPLGKFRRMVDNMAESFLITESWRKVQKRIK